MNLKIEAQQQSVISNLASRSFLKGISYKDEFTGTTTNILSDNSRVYLPYEIDSKAKTQNAAVDLTIEGAMCSAQQCRMINLPAQAKIEIAPGAAANPKFTFPLQYRSKRQLPSTRAWKIIPSGRHCLWHLWRASYSI